MRHVARIFLITLALILLGLALTPKASPAQTANPCDSTRLVPYWTETAPPQPCGMDSVSIVFRSCKDCVQLLSYEWPIGGPLRVNMRMLDVCPLTLVCRPDSLRIPLGRIAAGHYELAVNVVVGVVYGDTGYCTFTRRDTVRFSVGCPPPPDSLPYVQHVDLGYLGPCTLCPRVVCPGQPIPLHIDGMFPDGCYRFRGLELLAAPFESPLPRPPMVRLLVDHRTCGGCPLVVAPFTADTTLPALPPGTYNLTLQLLEVGHCDSLLTGWTEYHASKAFTVRDSCGPFPPTGPLPFVTAMTLDGSALCDTCRPATCPDVPIPFHVEGVFPNDCLQFRRIELVPSLPTVVGPPTVRIVVGVNDCLGRPCLPELYHWAGDVALPGLPPGSYRLPVEMAFVSWCDSTKVDSVQGVALSFTVRESCEVTPPGACVLAGWDHSQRVGICDTFLGAGDSAQVRMTIASATPLAGLQGVLTLYPEGPPPGLMITRLVPVGPAEGMHVAWSRQSDGVHFLMFAEHGAPIGGVRNCAGAVRCEQPVLAVVVGPGPAMVVPSPDFPPPVTYVSVHDLLGSDSLGTAVPECSIETALVAVVATICAGPSCDFNHDGTLDVRDLVTMVHCVLDTTCADTVGFALDCNGDGRLNVDDVLCCALHILHDGVRDTMPGRPEPGVAVDLGAPAWDGSGLEVPLHLRGADRVGAARLALALPLDRYDVTGVTLGDGGGQWLELHDVVDGRLVLGLIGLGGGGSGPSQLDLTLRLALKPGQAAGGDVTVADLQASGPDGATLSLATTPVTVPLPSPGALSLSPARPNPFGHETSFALNLDRAAQVEVTVHDLSGRRVATLFSGALAAGPHDFAWRGARDDGSAAPNGIYFLQARVGGERLTRKVIFLPGD